MFVRKIDVNLPDQSVIEYAAKLIDGGGVVVFPSDSCYGLAADATNRSAVERLYKIKQRPFDKQISCIFRDLEQIEQWTVVGKSQRKTLERNLPGPFTFVLQARVGCPLEGETVGVRIPDNSITRALAHTLGKPYTATSANISGEEVTYDLDEIFRNFERQIYQPDLILDAGKLPQYPTSAVVDIRKNRPVIIREGVAKVR
ncbi:MAG: threonylcarbamoyl-AMP synthase [Candidatus Berkelbacteria bacterium]|nr:MAG: threonylcarbamoyl-AMP synthase [Candidatus Berkelbacteria bacterium]QQG51384.1 MAG: threonylcarbamoyl-AMP synthase [Candidatus Berkelbacteria bacterium]